MMDIGKRYHILDEAGHYYKLDEQKRLVVAASGADAASFTIQEVNSRIGAGRRSRFYRVIEAPTMYDGIRDDWGEILTNLRYASEHMSEYQDGLNRMLSDVDKEISDIMHYLEFNDLDNEGMLEMTRMLQERRRRRRKIKNEMDKTALVCSNVLNEDFECKVRQSFEGMKRIEERRYTPRKLNELFDRQQDASA